MDKRLELQSKLEELLGSKNVYFQPPTNIKMSYPCIKYSLSNINNRKADDSSYNRRRSYALLLIDKDPDTDLVEKILLLPYVRFDRFYISDNLNHFSFTIFY